MRITPLVVSVCLLCSLSAAAQENKAPAKAATPVSSSSVPPKSTIDPAKERDIRQLLEVMGTRARMTLIMTEMEKSIKPLMEKSLPPGEYREKLIDAFFEKFHSKMDLPELLDRAVPIYDRHLTADEVKGLIQFYQTPLGKKTLEALPQMTTELMNSGRQWGEDLGRKSMIEVLAEHPEWQKEMEEASQRAPQQP